MDLLCGTFFGGEGVSFLLKDFSKLFVFLYTFLNSSTMHPLLIHMGSGVWVPFCYRELPDSDKLSFRRPPQPPSQVCGLKALSIGTMCFARQVNPHSKVSPHVKGICPGMVQEEEGGTLVLPFTDHF